MKILYITPGCFDKGGISRYSRYQIKLLGELYGPKNVRVLSFLAPDEHSFSEEVACHWYSKSHGLYGRITLVVQMVWQVLFWRPDVIHLAHVNYSGLGLALAKVSNAKCVLNIYGLEVWSGLSKFAEKGLKQIQNVISDCIATKEYVEENNIRTVGSMEVIWDCVDMEYFKPTPERWTDVQKKFNLPDREKHFIITTFGRLSKDAAYKGYDRLIKVFAKATAQQPHLRLLIAGKGNLLEELEALASSLQVRDKITFTGMVSDEDLPAILSYGHLFSLVTESGENKGEGIPLTPLEAMGCGLPIIVGNQDGSREAIFENRNGYIISPFDLASHEEIILKTAGSKEEYNRLKLGAKEVVNEYFSYESFKDKHAEFYKKIR
jgi:phosphatidylinositol alpha-1,6-mannosyltransferase